MTASEITQLAEAKKDIKYMQKDIQEIKDNQREQSDDIKEILERLDNLSGGKQALMWVTGIFISLAALAAAYINVLKDK